MKAIYALIITLLLSSNAVAEQFNRDYIELSASKQAESEGGFHGQSITISKAIDKNVFLRWNAEQSISGIDSITTGGGLGVQFETNDNAYLYGGIEYQRRDKSEGSLFRFGSYYYLFDNVVLTNELGVATINIDVYLSASSEIRFHLNKTTSIGFSVKTESNGDERKTVSMLSLRGGF